MFKYLSSWILWLVGRVVNDRIESNCIECVSSAIRNRVQLARLVVERDDVVIRSWQWMQLNHARGEQCTKLEWKRVTDTVLDRARFNKIYLSARPFFFVFSLLLLLFMRFSHSFFTSLCVELVWWCCHRHTSATCVFAQWNIVMLRNCLYWTTRIVCCCCCCCCFDSHT